ncbi:MAG TPA: transposase domain-containing protein [Haloplasmataceae bacterium]
MEIVKENHLKPYEYFKYLFDTLPKIDITDLEAVDQLLPWSKSIPEECRMKK